MEKGKYLVKSIEGFLEYAREDGASSMEAGLFAVWVVDYGIELDPSHAWASWKSARYSTSGEPDAFERITENWYKHREMGMLPDVRFPELVQ